jgi:membrane protein implicated in regulation of membrane protease activity
MEYYWWLIIALVLFIFEILTPGFVIMWFGVGALVAAACALLGVDNLTVQIVACIAVSLVLVTLSRTLFKNVFIKNSPGNDIKTNAEALIGKIGVVTVPIDNNASSGRILIEAQDWSARSADNSIIEIDSKVKAIKIDGAKFIVERI